MRFKITLNMPASSGKLVHQILCEHPARSLADLAALLETLDFLTVTQFYSTTDSHGNRALEGQGPLVIHRQVIGKIEELQER